MNDQLEHDLTRNLRAIAAHAPDGSGWNGIHGRIAQRVRARRRRGGAVAALMAVTVATGLVSSVDREGGRQVVAGPGPSARFILGLPGFAPVGATEAGDSPGRIGDGGLLAVLARPDVGLSGPALFVRTVPAGVDYGVGERSPNAPAVDIGGQIGYLQRYTSLSQSLGWRLADGSGVHLVSLRLTEAELLAAARALRTEGGAVGWAPGAMPAGLELRRSTSGSGPTDPAHAETYFKGPNGATLALRVQAADQHLIDTYVIDRVGAARQVSEVEVDGVPAVLSTYEEGDRRSLIWAVRPGLMAEIDGERLTDAQMLDAAESVRVAGAEEWSRLLARVGPPTDEPPTGEPLAGIADLATSRCALRDEWLAASAAGDRGRQLAVTRKLSDIIARYRAEGVQPDGDIYLVVDRSILAMQSDDIDAVEANACT